MIDGRIFCDQPISDFIKQYDEVRKVSAGQGHGYTIGRLLDYACFKDNYKLTAVDLSNSNMYLISAEGYKNARVYI